MAHEGVIDVCWRKLLAAAIDYVILATVKREETIRVEAADVPRFKPTIDKARSIEFWSVKIARNHRWPPHQNLALLPWRKPLSIISDDDNRIRPGNAACAQFRTVWV